MAINVPIYTIIEISDSVWLYHNSATEGLQLLIGSYMYLVQQYCYGTIYQCLTLYLLLQQN